MKTAGSRTHALLAFAAVTLPLLLAISCAGGGGKGSNPIGPGNPTAPEIVSGPASETIPVGQSASFTVTATGTGTLNYQWSENGTPIEGASSATYKLASVTASNTGAKFTVAVSNSAGSVTSSPALLTVGPRSPQPGDYRFKLVDYAPSLTYTLHTNIIGGTTTKEPNQLGTPLEVGSTGTCGGDLGVGSDCAWIFDLFDVPTGDPAANVTYASDQLSNIDADLTDLAQSNNTIVTALDEQPAYNVFAVSFLQFPQSSGYAFVRSMLDPSELQAAVANQAAQGKVVTAITVNASGQVDYLAYSWAPSTQVYEAQTVFSSFTSVVSDAASLAAQGYILTAVGGGLNNGFILVGTKVKGDTLPRSLSANANPGPGAAVVGEVFDSNGNTDLEEN